VRIIIIDDDESTCKTLSLIFNKQGYDVESVGTGHEALEKVKKRFFNLALLDIKLPDIEGVELLTPLKKIRPFMDIMMITGLGSIETAIHALNNGASSYITKPLNMDEILVKISDFLEKQKSIKQIKEYRAVTKKEDILIVDDDESTCKTLTFIFNKKGYNVETVGTGQEALDIAQHKSFNLALLDIKLPDVEGIDLLVPLKKMHPDMETIMMTAFSSFETVIRALNEGASAYIMKPLNIDDVLNKIDSIFERQRLFAEKMNLEQKLQYQAMLVENVSDAIISTDINLNIRSWNKGAEFIYGWKSDEIIGKPMSEIIPEEVPSAQNKEVKEHIFEKGFWRGEIIQKKKDNTRINIFSSATLIKDSSGKIQGVVIINRDITDRKKAEKILTEREKYDFIFEALTDGVLIIDNEWRYLMMNDICAAMTQMPKEELIGRKMTDLFPGVESTVFGMNYVKVFKTGEPSTVFDKFVYPDGRVVWYENQVFPIQEGLLIIVTDITERKKKEQTISNLARFPSENPNPVLRLTKEKVIYTNKQGEKLFNIRNGSEVPAVLQEILIKAFDANKTISTEITLNSKIFSLDITPIREEEYANVYGKDITKRKKAEAELKKTMKDLKNSNTELEQFAYVASHDLQEPLRMVASFTQLLQDRYKDKLDEDANDFINYAVDGATRMQNLINDLLIFSRVGSRGKPFKITDMNVVIENVLNNFRQLIKETNSMIIYDPLPVIEADESQMIQLFQNLISNGIKFRGENNPIIHVTAEIKADKWIFTVKDNGIGIDNKFFDRIFIIFQRLHKKSEYGGTGIGLAVCKKIVQRHGGKIWVDSEFGKGSSFHVSIKKRKQEKNSVSYS